jgi:hypothetical protein
MAVMMAAMPEKIAPTTKYGPKIVLCQPGRIVMPKIRDTTVWTETAMGMISTAMMPIPRSRRFRCASVPRQPNDSTR